MWSVVLLTDQAGEPIGELTNAYDRRVSYRLRRMTTCSFSVRSDDALAGQLLEGDVLIKLYEETDLRFVGDIAGGEEKSAGRVSASCADGFAPLATRLCGKSRDGYKKIVAADRGLIAKELIDQTNAEADTGLRIGTIVPSSADTPGPWYYKPIAESIGELAAPLDGIEWIVDPVEPAIDDAYPSPRPVIGTFNAFPAIGSFQPEAVFEFGDGRCNVVKWDRIVSRDGMVNRGYGLQPGFPDEANGTVQTWEDAASIARYGLRERVIPGDFADDALRLKLVQEHIRVRRLPRQMITFTAAREDTDDVVVPRFKVDFDIGDIVPFRAVEPTTGQVRVNASLRVYGVDVAPDDQGAEQNTIYLVEEAA